MNVPLVPAWDFSKVKQGEGREEKGQDTPSPHLPNPHEPPRLLGEDVTTALTNILQLAVLLSQRKEGNALKCLLAKLNNSNHITTN